MPISIYAATCDDAESIVQIVCEAYQSTPSPAHVQALALTVLRQDLQRQSPDVFPEWIVAKDDTTGTVISYMQLVYETQNWAEVQIQKMDGCSKTSGEEATIADKRHRRATIRSLRLHAVSGKIHLCVSKHCNSDSSMTAYFLSVIKQLATRPTSQRQGAGSSLMELAIARASQLGVILYLDGREDALDFYKKFDFQSIDSVFVSNVVGGGQYKHVSMIRYPPDIPQ